MIFERLVEYASDGNFEAPPPMYARRPVRYVVDIDHAGRLVNGAPLDTSESESPGSSRGQIRLAPTLSRSKGIRPLLLADNAEYTLGVARKGSATGRVTSMHRAYTQLVEDCTIATGDPAVRGVLNFLRSGSTKDLSLGDDFNPAASITFRVGGEFPIESPEIQRYWSEVATEPGTRALQCLVCGEARPALDRLNKRAKGIPRAAPAGVSLFSANMNAFESYGLRNSHVAPTCAGCAEKFTEGINQLLSDDSCHLRFHSASLIFWTRHRTRFDWSTLLEFPSNPGVQGQVEALKKDRWTETQEGNPFYCAVLSSNRGRMVLRYWLETTAGEVKRKLASWYSAQSMVTRQGGSPSPLGIHPLAAATARTAGDIGAQTVVSLVHSALSGAALPRDVLHGVMRCIRSDQRVTRSRAALLKLALSHSDHAPFEASSLTELDLESRDPGYLCGRLLYLLENAHRTAVPGIRTTSAGLYFSQASSTPATAFQILVKRTQHHLDRVRTLNGGAHRAIIRGMEAVMGDIPVFPSTLSVERQGLFALGYYHQRAAAFSRMGLVS